MFRRCISKSALKDTTKHGRTDRAELPLPGSNASRERLAQGDDRQQGDEKFPHGGLHKPAGMHLAGDITAMGDFG